MRYAAAFRTHIWDDDIAELARRFFDATPSARQVVLVDETRGPIDIPAYEKISHTSDTSCLGLPNHPAGRSLWFNADYGFYFLRRALPDFDYYLVSESDLAVNLSLEPMMRLAIDRGIDMAAHRIERSIPHWFWHTHGLAISDAPWRSLLFFTMLSRRAVDSLLAARLEAARRFAGGEADLWPFCEAFVPTVLKSISGMRFIEVSEFAGTEDLSYRPWFSLHDPRASRPGTLVHPVLGGKRFIQALLSKHPPRDFFREGSELRDGLLSQTPFENIAEPLRRALAKGRDHAGIALLAEEGPSLGLEVYPPSEDLAFCKPALSSSVSRWSRYPDPERDACGANGDPLAYDFGFHTQQENNPWWMVDLLGEHLIEEVAIVNRLVEQQRFRTFRIETSLDGSSWITRFAQTTPADISADPEWPWRVHFPTPFAARYVRVVLLGVAVLHLRRVQIFGPGSEVTAKRFIGRLLAKYPPRDFFREESELRQGLLSQTQFENVFEQLRRALAQERDHAGVCLLYEEAAKHGWPLSPWQLSPKGGDLAFCKPALSSSVSRWSRYRDPERDACGANGDPPARDYGFHTQQETDPWWMVDLRGEHIVEEIAIVNRLEQQQRFRQFRIEGSLDGSSWTTQFVQAEPSDVSADPERPWRLSFPEPFSARYLRIVLSGVAVLHLRRVQVFGR